MELSIHQLLILILAIFVIIGVAFGRYPVLRMNRATITLVGATGMILAGALTLEEAYAVIDMNTIVLLFGMMILNANLRMAGFFRLVSENVIRWARTPRMLLWLIVLSSGVLSALFLNDTIVLMLTPLIIEVTVSLRRNPVPYLIGLATAANIGSAATITGNPQNMLIGISSGIPYTVFTAALGPVALAGLVVAGVVIQLVYPQEFRDERLVPVVPERTRRYAPLLRKSLFATAGMLVAFILGAPIPLVALAAAAFLLVTRRVKPVRVFREVDWTLLVFFSGLFVVTGALETSGISRQLFRSLGPLAEGGIVPLAGVSVLLSNLISNVPAVLLFRPMIPMFPDPQESWLVLAMATTLAGNLTLLGSVANLIVAEIAGSVGVKLTFGAYLRAGVPITLISLAIGVIWLFLT